MSNLKFGGLAVPGSGVVLSQIDLNDRAAWRTLTPSVKLATIVQLARQNWRGESSRIAGDRSPLEVDLEFQFDETVAGHAFALEQAKISQAGEQWLQINSTQRVLVEYLDLAPKLVKRGPYGSKIYGGTLSLIARKGVAEDISASSLSPVALAGSTGAGSTTPFGITYDGAVRTRPVWTLDIPSSNTVTITQFKLQNTLSGEVLTVNFPTPLAASTHWVITIDTDKYTIKDAGSGTYDPVGSFPKLYPPPGTDNTFSATVVTGSGTSTGVTLSAAYTNRWEVQF